MSAVNAEQDVPRAAPGRTIVVVSDGKAGHLNQSLGLAEALVRLCPNVGIREIPSLSRSKALLGLLRPPPLQGHVALLIGAGHGTHLSLLALQRRCPCPTVVLMRPSLPSRCFDLCIEPRHDGGRESDRRWLSDGPLNRMAAEENREPYGVILVGGPSAHYTWDSQAVVGQIARICDGSRSWCLSTSRRTPRKFLPLLKDLSLPGLELHDVATLPPQWLVEHLARAEQCWVTPDSASMIYEGLTAGCAVGVLSLQEKARSRVARGVADLVQRGLVSSFADFDRGGSLRCPEEPFDEAARMARKIVERGWL